MKARDFNDAGMDGDGAEFDGIHEAANNDRGAENSHIRKLSPEYAKKWSETAPPKRRWLIKDCLLRSKVGLIVAQGGAGKSRLACQLAVSVSASTRFIDTWEIGDPGPVLTLFAEDDEEDLHQRFHHAIAAANLSQQQKENLYKRLYTGSVIGHDNYMTAAGLDGIVSETDRAEELIRYAKEIPDLRLIILDPLSCFRGGNENDAADTTKFVVFMRRLAEETKANVIGVHHVNKASMSSDDANQSASRGSSALTDGARWQLNISVMSEKEARGFGIPATRRRYYIKLSITKSNYGLPQEDIWLENDTIRQVWRRVTLVSRKGRDDETLKQKIVELVKLEALKGKYYSQNNFIKRFGGKDGTLAAGETILKRVLPNCIDEGRLRYLPPIIEQPNVKAVLMPPEDPEEESEDTATNRAWISHDECILL